MKIMKPVFLCVAGVATGLLFAEDLTVGIGESVTVSENATYDNVTVNGALSVADGVTLTANTSFVVADGISGTATVTLGEESRVDVTASDGTKFGVGAGRAEVTLGTRAYFDANGAAYVCYGYAAEPADANAKATEAALTLGENATFYCGTELIFGGGMKPTGTKEATVTAWVRLNNRANLSVQRITDSSYTSEIIEFNGGQVVQRTGSTYASGFIRMLYAAKKSYLYLDSIDGQDVRFYLPGAGKYTAFANYGSVECRVVVRGEGDFHKTGDGEFPFVKDGSDSPTDPCLRFLNNGALVISAGGFVLNSTNILQGAKGTYSKNVDVRIDSGAWLDLGGMDYAVLGSVQAKGSGLLKNSGAKTTLLTVGASGGDSHLPRIEGAVDLIKTGAGKLTLCADELVSLDIRAGSVEFLDRQHMGYPFYRFQVDAHRAGFNSKTSVRINELAFLNEGSDITRPYVRLHHDKTGSSNVADPVLMVDGNLSSSYYDLRAAYNDERLARVGVTLEYADCQLIDGYKLAFCDNRAKWAEDPTAWRVFGGFSPTDLVALDQVAGFSLNETRDGWVSPDFTVAFPETTTRIPTLKIASGVKVKVVGGTVTSESSTTAASGLELTLSSGASIPLTANQSVAKMAIDLDKGAVSVGVLNPEAVGEIRLTGSSEAVKGALANATSCSNAANLRKWDVYVNGVKDDRKLVYANGAVRLEPRGLLVVFR